MGEPAEARTVQVHCQRLVASHKHVDTQIELLAADKKWVHDILLNDVRFSLWTVRLPSEVIFPLRDLSELIKQEDASTLGLANWFHDPYATDFAELLHEERVVAWQVVSRREEIETESKSHQSD